MQDRFPFFSGATGAKGTSPIRGCFSRQGNHAQIVVRPLIGPAALAIIRILIFEIRVECHPQVQRRNRIRFLFQLKRNSITVFSGFRHDNTDGKGVSAERTVVLNQKIERCFRRKDNLCLFHRKNDGIQFFPKKIERVLNGKHIHGELEFLPVRPNLRSAEFRRRNRHVERDLGCGKSFCKLDLRRITPDSFSGFRNTLPERSFQFRHVDFRHQRIFILPSDDEVTFRLRTAAPLVVETSDSGGQTADFKISLLMNFQFRKQRQHRRHDQKHNQ